jgi:hypothetical protein
MSPTKLSLAGNNLSIPSQGEFGKLHPGWGRENLLPFLQCNHVWINKPFLKYCFKKHNQKARQMLMAPLKVQKIEIFFGFDFEICIISLLVMPKY